MRCGGWGLDCDLDSLKLKISTPLLIDIGPLCKCGSDHVLDEMHKALSAPDDDGIWAPHESVFIRGLIEQATSKGIANLQSLKDELLHFLTRSRFGAQAPKPVIDGGMVRWSSNLVGAVHAYLDGLPTESWSAGDYTLLVDYLAQKYLPPEFAISESEWLIKRAAMMGKVQSLVATITPETAGAMLDLFADSKHLEAVARLAGLHQAVLDYGQAKCADYIVSLTDALRHKLKSTILDYEATRRMGGTPDNSSLQQALHDHFSDLNRDWRRIAVTEAGEMANQGFIAGVKPGEKVRRVEQYANACAFCKKWNGKTLTVVEPSKKDKDWDAEVWVGKTNIGRSASPYKRVGGALVKRQDSEMWKPAAGVFHPHCRGRWLALGEPAKADEFSLWLDGFLAEQLEAAKRAAGSGNTPARHSIEGSS